MPKFGLKKIESVGEGKQTFEELVLDPSENKEKNKLKGQLTEFENELEEAYKSDFKKILSYMSFVSNLVSLPRTKFKDVTPDKEKIKEYEFKSGDLRIYCIQKHGGKIIILGGYKNSQKKDFVKFRSLKKQYLESIDYEKK